MTEITGTGRCAPGERARQATVNQVVAWNVARYRKAAGLTQAGFGAMIGWTGAAVSDAERSWKGGRVREFDAHTMTVIAVALGVPVIALLLPPDDDGGGERWEVDAGPARGIISMGQYLARAVLPDPEGDDDDWDTPALAEYARRYARSVDRYIPGPLQNARAMRWMRDRHPRAVLTEFAARLRRHQSAAADAAAFAGDLAAAIEEETREHE